MFMIMLVLDQPEFLDDILKAWEDAGITGATIIESSGLYRRTKRKSIIPTRYVMPALRDAVERGNYTLLSIVQDEQQVQVALQATEQIVGVLDHPHSGVFAAWPLTLVKGISSRSADGGEEE